MRADAAHPLTPLLVALGVLLAVSVAGQMVGSVNNSAELSYFSAFAFAAGVLKAAWQVNRPWWSVKLTGDIGPVPRDTQPRLATINAALLSLGFVWGAASMFGVYLGTPLKWQHGWQYGTILALAAVGTYAVYRNLAGLWDAEMLNRLTWSTLILCWTVGGALFWLAGTGKLLSRKPDWAANIIFVTGGLIICGVCSMWLRSARLVRARTESGETLHP